MKIKCDYCGSYIDDTEEKCSNCGATNSHLQRKAVGTPTTIEELDRWYKEHNLPPEEVTRFFIGKNYTKAKAFGIYKDEESGNFIVYKNKSDGTRSIRYEGKDEAYAVNELYMKLKEEIVNQKSNNKKSSKKNDITCFETIFCILLFILAVVKPFLVMCVLLVGGAVCGACFAVLGTIYDCVRKRKFQWTNFLLILISIVISIVLSITFIFIYNNTIKKGYYYYDDIYYYYQSGTWYEYDDYLGWYESYAPYELEQNYSDYYESKYYYSDYDIEDFKDSDYYDYSSSDWDSSSSWDSSDSWDSGSTDWDSDW